MRAEAWRLPREHHRAKAPGIGRKAPTNSAIAYHNDPFQTTLQCMPSVSRICARVADITTLGVDAIVNAANCSLLGGGGVDGAIHRAAGPELLAECKTLGGCPTGQARITRGYRLPAKFVIHTVGPVWHGGGEQEPEVLASCYRNCMQLALQNKLVGVAFPAISCGVYGFPKHQAARLAVHSLRGFFSQHPEPVFEVTLVAFDQAMCALYETAMAYH